MPVYTMKVEVVQEVSSVLGVQVKASNKQDAQELVSKSLEVYPKPLLFEGVLTLQPQERKWGSPTSVKISHQTGAV